MRSPSAFVLVLLGTVASGCGHVETHAAMLRAPETPVSHVELYLANQAEPARPYYDIAVVQAIGFGADAKPDHVARALEDKAGALGCDAVVHAFIDVGYSRVHAAGTCVRWLAPGPPGPEALLPPSRGDNPPPPPIRPQPAPKIEPLPSSPEQSH
jgi:hypothetical protein